MGYHRAGFEVVGVDNRPQPRYPFRFIQADAFDYLFAHGAEKFSVIHASPPCQQFSVAKRLNPNCNHPDLIEKTRCLLMLVGKDFVIENVPGSPLRNPILVCGLALGLNVKRHRLFESSVLLFGTDCPRGHRDSYLTIFGNDGTFRKEKRRGVTVFGGGAPKIADNRRRATMEQRKEAMGIDWMTRDQMSLAIPPAYTEFVGKQLLAAL